MVFSFGLINHGYGYKSRYPPERLCCKAEQKGQRGELIGYVGNTGLSTTTSSLWEVEKDGIKGQPDQLLL